MTMIDPATGWFEIVKITTFDLGALMAGNNEYIYKSYARLSQMFNNTWLCRYPRPRSRAYQPRHPITKLIYRVTGTKGSLARQESDQDRYGRKDG